MATFAPPQPNIVINHIDLTEKPQQEGRDEANYVDDKKGNRDLPDELKTAFKTLRTHYGTVVDRTARRVEVVDARRQRFYDRGYQYIYFNKGSGVFLPITGGQVMNSSSDSVQMPRYTNVYNIYKPYRRNFCATLTQNAVGTNFEPVDPTASLDIKTAQAAHKYADHYDQVNNIKKMQSKIGRLFWTDGRVVTVTTHERNAQKWGTHEASEDYEDYEDDKSEEDLYKDSKSDDGDKEKTYPNGEEITRIYGVIEAKVFPITADSQDDLLGVIISDDPEINIAKTKYPWIAEDIKTGDAGTGESAFERNARIGVLQGMSRWVETSDSYAHLVERQHMYIRPAAFRHLGKDVRSQLRKIYPLGAKVLFVSGEYAQSWNCSMDDEVHVDHALDGDGMNRPSWGFDMRPVQDAFNNYRNMRQEYHDYGIPITYVDDRLADGQAFREQISQPGQFQMVTNPNPAVPLEQFFFMPLAANAPADLIQAEQDLRDALSQLISGVQSALFGGNLGGGKEADRVGVYQMAREQAMGVMSLPWGVMQTIVTRCKYQAALAAAKNRRAEDKIHIVKNDKRGRPGKTVSIEIGDLLKGKFRSVPNSDSTFPSSRSMKKQALTEFFSLAQDNPMVQEATMQPGNLELAAELEGMSEIDIPAARAYERQRDEIDQLLSTGPIPPTMQQVKAAEAKAAMVIATGATQAGQAAPPQLPPQAQGPTPEQWADPNFISSGAWLDNTLMLSMAKCSLDPDEEDYHQYHVASIKEWFNSDEREKAIDEGNRAGIVNLRLHKKLHDNMMQAEAAKAGQQQQGKPPTISMALKDMPVPEKIQALAKAGIQASPADFALSAPQQLPPDAAA